MRSPFGAKARLRAIATHACFTLVVAVGHAEANDFGTCAHERDTEHKIFACAQAAGRTTYPWILHWVHREMARAHRERGEVDKAKEHYVKSLQAEERHEVRTELERVQQTLELRQAAQY